MEERKHSIFSLIVLMLTFSVFPLWPIVSVLTAIIILLFNLVALLLQFIYQKRDDKIKYEKVQKYLHTYWRYLISIFFSCFLGYLISGLASEFIMDYYWGNVGLIYFTSISILILILALISFFRDKKRKFYSRTSKISITLIIITILLNSLIIPNMFYRRPRPTLSSCSGNLRNMGIIVTNYSTDHKGHYPQNLKVLVELGYIKTLPTCPATDKPYILEIDGWDDCIFTVWCPNPTKHTGSMGPKSTTASLYYSAGKGVFQVDE